MTKKIGIIIGSLRKKSWNRKLALALIPLAPSTLNMEIIEINDLALYNQDFDDENHPPTAWTTFRDCGRDMDGFLFVTPEYNRSIPSPMKNAIDVGSRPYGKSIWRGKPGAIISSSVGAVGGFGSNQHLRQSLVTLNVPCMPSPEAYLGNISELFDEKFQLAKAETQNFLHEFMQHYAKWVDKFS